MPKPKDKAKYNAQTTINGRALKPESLMMSHAYRPEWSEGSLKVPIFQTSTFVFKSAEEGKAFFELAYGLRQPDAGEEPGLIYSRLNNPDLEVLEDRLKLWDEAEACTVFESGMAAIATSVLEFAHPGDVILHCEPLYGGTDHFFKKVLVNRGIKLVGFSPDDSVDEVLARVDQAGARGKVTIVFVETPGNPTNQLVDLQLVRQVSERLAGPHPTLGQTQSRPIVMVDNTFLGPLWQRPLQHGADLVLYSATKFLGGHSDLIAGVALGSTAVVERVRGLRTFLGTLASPWTGWLLLRSLETLKLRMTAQQNNARVIAKRLRAHPKVNQVLYLEGLAEGSKQEDIYRRQCLGPGSMISFELNPSSPQSAEEGAFQFLNHLSLFKLAVSLGGTESLAEHPASMTHADVSDPDKVRLGITSGLVRLSIGVEDADDLWADLEAALSHC